MNPTTDEVVISEASAVVATRPPQRAAFRNSLANTKRLYEDLETNSPETPIKRRAQRRPAVKVGSTRKKTSIRRNTRLNGTPKTELATEDTGSPPVDVSLPLTPSTTAAEDSDGHEMVQADTPSAEADHRITQADTPSTENDHQMAQTDIPSAEDALDESTLTEAPDAGDNSVKGSGPPPMGQPPIWAERRGGLCEALDYYKSYKGSLYTRKDVGVLGFLIDSEVDPRDVFGTQVIISSL